MNFIKGEVVSIDIKNNAVCGVFLRGGEVIKARSLVITCGTFLSGMIHVGNRKIPAGRMGEGSSEGITENLISV